MISFVNLISVLAVPDVPSSIVQCSTRFDVKFAQSPRLPTSVITHNHPRALPNWKINQDFSFARFRLVENEMKLSNRVCLCEGDKKVRRTWKVETKMRIESSRQCWRRKLMKLNFFIFLHLCNDFLAFLSRWKSFEQVAIWSWNCVFNWMKFYFTPMLFKFKLKKLVKSSIGFSPRGLSLLWKWIIIPSFVTYFILI